MTRFIEGKGDSPETAIKIMDADHPGLGVKAEYEYLERKFGQRNKHWQLALQSFIQHNGGFYDRMDLSFSNGSQKLVYFDITHMYIQKSPSAPLIKPHVTARKRTTIPWYTLLAVVLTLVLLILALQLLTSAR
jgi:hypothetical protein